MVNAVGVLVSDFDFELPDDLIAQEAVPRGASRLLVLDRASGALTHTSIARTGDFLTPGDLLVVNNTRVFAARLLGRRDPSGGWVECLLLDPPPAGAAEAVVEALVHPGQKLKPGARVRFDDAGRRARVQAEILDRHFHGRRTIRLWTTDGGPLEEAIEAIGHVPLPPYIKRPDTTDDRERYQTMFARVRGSVAAPTAGLHFTPELVEELRRRGVERAEITLHVGYGTFKPVRTDTVEAHVVDPEHFEIGEAAAAAINRALDERRRVIAVGTTTTRTLEHAARESGGRIAAVAGVASLFIYPGFEFRVLGGLVTNFHVPRSSLLMLAAAFAGRERLLAAYREAVRERYRFYSYGDAMLIL